MPPEPSKPTGPANRFRVAVLGILLSAGGLVFVAQREGYSSQAIIPVPGDVPTIGFGTTTGVKMGDKITPQEAMARLLADVSKFEGALKECVKVPLTQAEYDAYLSLAYNIGAGAFCGSTLVKLLNAGDYAGACAQISRWNKQNGRELAGLTKRREAERAKCEGRA